MIIDKWYPVKKVFSDYTDSEREFYFYLGVLSIKFAEIESYTIDILGSLITDDIFLINPIIEKNSLSQNIELLRKINLYKSFEENLVDELISRLGNVRKNRNLFIHSLWGKPYDKNGVVMIDCVEQRVSPKMVTLGRMWMSGKEHSFRLVDIVNLVKEVDNILNLQKLLIEKSNGYK